MNTKQFVVGALVGTVALYILGYIIWDVLVADFFSANMGSASGVERETQLIWASVVGTAGYAVLLTLAIGTRAGSATVADGLKVGAIVGFLVWFTVDFILLGAWNVSSVTLSIVDPVLEGIRASIGGAAIAAVLGKL